MAKLIALVLLALSFQVNAEVLCGISEVDELDVKEEELEFELALYSIETLKSLEQSNSLSSFELQIARHNHMLIVEGTLLKQHVLFLRKSYENNGIDSNMAKYEKALEEFCEYLENAKYID